MSDIGAGPAEWREIDDHGIAGPHDAFHRAADREPLVGTRQGRITGILLIGGKHTEEPVLLADGALSRPDLARIGQKDLRPGEIDARAHHAVTCRLDWQALSCHSVRAR